MAKNPIIESMTTVERLGVTVRVWRQEDSLARIYPLNKDLKEYIQELIENRNSIPLIIETVVKSFDRINAIEVKDEYGDGSVFYPDWP